MDNSETSSDKLLLNVNLSQYKMLIKRLLITDIQTSTKTYFTKYTCKLVTDACKPPQKYLWT